MRFMSRVLQIVLIIFCVTDLSSLPMAQAKQTTQKKLSLAEGFCVTKAQMLFSDGRVQEAIDTLSEFINRPKHDKHPGGVHYYLHFLLGNYLSTLFQDISTENDESDVKKPDLRYKAVQCYRIVIKKNPLFCAAWLNLAKCYYEMENFKEAALAFENAYEHSDQKKAIHLYYSAVCHFQSQNSEKALFLFNALLQKYPGKVLLSWKEIFVNILFSLERYQEALPHIQELASKNPYPKRKKWQEILLHQYLNLCMDKKALSFANELTRTDPLESKWWKVLSHIHLKNGNQEKGLSALIIYGFLSPMTLEEFSLAADLYLSLDVPQKAADLYQHILEQDQDTKNHSSGKFKKLAQALAMAHDPENAIKWIDRGLTRCGQKEFDSDLLLMKARLLKNKKNRP